MFKDIRMFIDDKLINYEYKIDQDKITIVVTDHVEKEQSVKIVFDENIYDLVIEDNFKVETSGEIMVDLKSGSLTFKVSLKKNFFVKSIYKFINKLISKDELIEELNMFSVSQAGKCYFDDIQALLDVIQYNDKDLDELLINFEDENERVYNTLINNALFIKMLEEMSALELVLLISYYIYVPNPPDIGQEKFDELVVAGKDYDHSLENLWRLAMNYDGKGYNYHKLDQFFVDSRDIWYLGEYISGVCQINRGSIIDMIIDTKDSEFIKRLLDDEFFLDHIEEEHLTFLKDALKK